MPSSTVPTRPASLAHADDLAAFSTATPASQAEASGSLTDFALASYSTASVTAEAAAAPNAASAAARCWSPRRSQ